jgi:hypothetical protein
VTGCDGYVAAETTRGSDFGSRQEHTASIKKRPARDAKKMRAFRPASRRHDGSAGGIATAATCVRRIAYIIQYGIVP